mgnify:CR=1 FL=1
MQVTLDCFEVRCYKSEGRLVETLDFSKEILDYQMGQFLHKMSHDTEDKLFRIHY